MTLLNKLEPWRYWAFIFGSGYLTVTIIAMFLFHLLNIQGEAGWVLSVLYLPSLLIGLLLPDFSPRINMLVFILLIVLNAMLYAAGGMLIGFLFGRKAK